ncbi:MAG: response regulator [Cellvibrionaceae bacterium]
MSSPHALIVDDSKTAQLRLKRMLEAYDLRIDVVSSAEEALAYLSYRAPAVIFLDQSMKGMDGIEALKTIKANPATATIPVIMYTSEKGDVFTGQARALGALDILYKSSLKPSSLEKMLASLKIPSRKSSPTPSPGATPSPQPHPELAEIRGQIARLFEIHIADVGRQIDKSTQFLGRRITASLEQIRSRPMEVVVGDLPLSVLNDEVSAERRRIALVSNGLLCLLLVGLVAMGALLWQLRGSLANVAEDYQTASAMAEMNAAQILQMSSDLYGAQTAARTSAKDTVRLLDAIAWAAKADLRFDYDQEPLNEDLLNEFQPLVYLLAAADFRGVVEMRLHFGNACLAYNDGGELELAADELGMNECVFRQSLGQEFPVSDYLGLPYLSFEQLTPPLRDGNIDLIVSSVGLDEPRVQYPHLASVESAGQWNQVALQNNYVSLAFYSLD